MARYHTSSTPHPSLSEPLYPADGAVVRSELYAGGGGGLAASRDPQFGSHCSLDDLLQHEQRGGRSPSPHPDDLDEQGRIKPCGAIRRAGRRIAQVCQGDVRVVLFAFGLLVASTGNSIMIKKMTDKMNNYPYFLSQLTTFIYLPIFFGIVLYEYKYTVRPAERAHAVVEDGETSRSLQCQLSTGGGGDHSLAHTASLRHLRRNSLTPEMFSFPKRKFMVMGLFDALSGLCVLWGGIHTSGSFQAMLNNAVIPITVALSMWLLGTQYLRSQRLGAVCILIGVCVILIPLWADGGSPANTPSFNVIYLFSTVPQACSSLYKEVAFGDAELDVNFLQAWVALFQFIIGILLAPLNALPILKDASVSFDRIPDTLTNGARCFGGINSVLNSTVYDEAGAPLAGTCWTDTQNRWGAPANSHCDDCEGAWAPTVGYMIFNCLYNLFIVLVLKYGNAALLWIILTVRLPLVQIAFAITAINDPPDPFRITSVLGLFVIMGGLVMYRYASVMGGIAATEEEMEDDEDAAAAAAQEYERERGGSEASQLYT